MAWAKGSTVPQQDLLMETSSSAWAQPHCKTKLLLARCCGDVEVIQAGKYHKALFAHALFNRYYCDYINTIIFILCCESKHND